MNQNNVKSQRGTNKFVHEGFVYVKDKDSIDGATIFWRCDRKYSGCRGRIWTNSVDGTFNCLRRNHTCCATGDAARIEVLKVQTNVKHRAASTMETPSQIRTEVLQNASAATLGRISSSMAMAKMVNRVRRKENVAPAIPDTRRGIEVPENYKQYEVSEGVFENYLLMDSGNDDDNRILVFGREYNQTWAHDMRDIFMDGTFLLAPPLFKQIFVVLARRGERYVFPVLFCLLPNKTTQTYRKLFFLIKQQWPRFNPETINVDYEVAIHDALRTEFPEADVRGCFFHLVQNLRKHLSSSNLLGRYQTDADFALQARMITYIIGFYDLEPIVAWFTNTYVGRLRNNGTRAPPNFPYATWSVLQRTLAGSDRTNNYAEALHRKLQLGFGVAHPSIWKFLDGLKKIQKLFDATYEDFVAAREPPLKRRRYDEADRRILTKVQNFDAGSIIEYLRGLSHNYRME
ncbi:hypothetical protein PPYR_07376 [Photinus pyralis]|uniref:MULE transposase domain-containing protein n=1 Tax=Photinus pyralis TaxID=7054 RepID=A0A5N4AQC6_PHOPY|nr:hypothetical protein PPYR_07376 [Photinus pyralis]